jgi:hypothetical protein
MQLRGTHPVRMRPSRYDPKYFKAFNRRDRRGFTDFAEKSKVTTIFSAISLTFSASSAVKGFSSKTVLRQNSTGIPKGRLTGKFTLLTLKFGLACITFLR